MQNSAIGVCITKVQSSYIQCHLKVNVSKTNHPSLEGY